MSVPRELVLRLLVVVLLAGPGIAALCWPAPKSTVKSDDVRNENDLSFDPLGDWSTVDCLSLVVDDLASATDRLQAINALARRGDKGLLPLRKLLRHSSPTVRRYAAMGVGQFGPRAVAALPEMLALTCDKDVGVQIPAIDGLVRLAPRDRRVLEAVLVSFDSDNGTVRLAACDSLRIIIIACPEKTDEFEEILMENLRSPHQQVRMAMVGALGECRPPRTMRLLEIIDSREQALRLHAISVIGGLGADAAPAVSRILQLTDSRNLEEQLTARRTLARLAQTNRKSLLEGLAATNSLAMRAEASLLLATTQPDDAPKVLPTLTEAAHHRGADPFWWARLQIALHALGDRAQPVTEEFERSPLPYLRDLAAAVQRRGSQQDVATVWVLDLNNPSAVVRTRAAYRLGMVPTDGNLYAEQLLGHRDDDDGSVREAVNWAVQQIEATIGPMRITTLIGFSG